MSTSEVNNGSSVGTRRERVHLMFICRKEGNSCWLWLVVRIVIMNVNFNMYLGVTFGPFCIHTLYICPLNEFSDVATSEIYHYSCHHLYCWINMLTVYMVVYGYVRWAFWLNRFWNRWNCVLKGSPSKQQHTRPKHSE